MRRLLPALLTDDVLPATELRAAELDGDLRTMGSAWITPDMADDPQARARVLSALLPPRLMAERRSAAWVHGAISTAPLVHQLCGHVRERPPRSARTLPVPVHVREVDLAPHDVTRIGPLTLTTRLRTAYDLARVEPVFGDCEREIVRRLIVDSGTDPDAFIDSIGSRGPIPDKHRAVERIRSALP